MKLPAKISGLIILICLTPVLFAQDNICNIRKTYAVRNGSALKFSNKYGDVNFVTVNDDSLSVCALITIVQDDMSQVRKSMELITIIIEQKKDTVYVSTSFSKKFFSEAARLGRKNFTVDYVIKMPVYMNLSIKNEFGNISIDELSGPLNLNLSQGNLTALKLTRGNLKPLNSIYVAHGKIVIDEINWMTLTLRNCPEASIVKAQALNIISANSKISIENASSLVINSKSDKYQIGSINNIVSNGTYSSFELGKLTDQIKSKIRYGSLNIIEINDGFRNVDITSAHSNMSLTFEPGVSFTGDITTTDAILDFPAARYPGITKTGNNSSTSLTGFTGADKNSRSVIKISAMGGKVTLK